MATGQSPKWGVVYNADALPLSEVLDFAALAEQAGADSLWTAEGWRDGFVPLSAMASRVNRVRLGYRHRSDGSSTSADGSQCLIYGGIH